MTIQADLDLLKQDINRWNRWRSDHPEIVPDLSDVDLNSMDLSYADLSRTNCEHANFSNAILGHAIFNFANLKNATMTQANLKKGKLKYANLEMSNLRGADLTHASLIHANIALTNFIGANLSEVDLREAILNTTDLRHANLSDALLGWTKFCDVDLRQVIGLETIRHSLPSTIGIDTIYRSQGYIPATFLRGTGVPEPLITYIQTIGQNPISYYTCFISYSSQDYEFTKQLYADLQSQGLRCWYAPESLSGGDNFRSLIEESIMLYDKFIVVLSSHSIISPWVELEMSLAEEKDEQLQQRNTGKTVIFPIKIDEDIMQIDQGWAAKIRQERHIVDFTQWRNYDEYQKAILRLTHDLQVHS